MVVASVHLLLQGWGEGDAGSVKDLVAHAKEFVRRWAMHILPKGYTRSRHFGAITATNNLINSCTNSYYDGSGEIAFLGDGDVTTAPSFTDEANDDYTVTQDSPAVGAGIKPGGIT